ncbi:diguanylate cyclase [Solibacillus sp. CAU 1738]|uniref:sensor domain-containing diguanylate cyclase n=1 Tax=Solibacillus sp. CAU 1738 TaxID=3140363 RepID=UPI0032618AF3
MNLEEAIILLFTHGIPILFFMYMATNVLLRNRKKTEHILLALIALCYLLLFAEEYVRNQVSIEYSGILSSVWLSSIGIIIPGLCFHFLLKLTQLDRYFPKYIFPYVLYLPVLFVIYNLTSGANLIAAQQFEQVGMWILPIYNAGYYTAMTGSIIIDVLFLFLLGIANFKSPIKEQKSIYNLLIVGIVLAIIWHCIFGYIHFGHALPPYPYLYSGIIWCFFLQLTMKKYDFLNLYDRRYEKLFDMNPNAILLINSRKTIKNANPSAYQFFDAIQLDFKQFFELLSSDIKSLIENSSIIDNYETIIVHQNKQIVLLIYADYVLVDNEMHTLLIIQDITTQKKHQEEINFLAYHDTLTRLPNRRYFNEKFDDVLEMAKQNNHIIVLFLIDLNQFKLLNDTRGHLTGDEILKIVAQILQETASIYGVVARMGGDEFIMFINQSLSNQDTWKTIQQIQQQFLKSITKYGNIPVSLSIGFSCFPEDSEDSQALINIADNKMYAMKKGHIKTN